VQVTTLATLAAGLGSNRIALGQAITNPVGAPGLEPENERLAGRAIVRTALKALTLPIEKPTIFYPQL